VLERLTKALAPCGAKKGQKPPVVLTGTLDTFLAAVGAGAGGAGAIAIAEGKVGVMDLTGDAGADASCGDGAGTSAGCGDGSDNEASASSSPSAAASADSRHAIDPHVNTCIICPHGNPATKPLASKGQSCVVKADAWAAVLAGYPLATALPVCAHTVEGCPVCRRAQVHTLLLMYYCCTTVVLLQY